MKRIWSLIPIFSLYFLLSACCCQHYVSPYVPTPPCAPQPKPLPPIEVALALGTGGFNGTAHLGVIEVLEKAGIPIDLIVGCSAGSIMGAFYCDRPNSMLLREKLKTLTHSDFIDNGCPPFTGSNLEKFLAENLCAQNFEELKIPFVAVTTDIKQNKTVLLRSGPIPPAIHASAAIPGIFKPVELYGHCLVDGGIFHPVPAQIARSFHPKLVIAVNIVVDPPFNHLKNSNEIRKRAIDLSFNEFSHLKACEADIAIHPAVSVCEKLNETENIKNYKAGIKAAMAALPEIKRKMKELNISLRHRKIT